MHLQLHRRGRLYEPATHSEVKDPTVAFDGNAWHLFATARLTESVLQVLHATAPSLDGPWTEMPAVRLVGVENIRDPAAPGVIADGPQLHMFLQHNYNVLGGCIEHLVSDDGGTTFVHHDTALTSLASTCEAGVYDPDPAIINGEYYLTYAAMSAVGQPDLFVATSTSRSWDGPWERCGRILGQEEVEFHNQLDDEDYEWGLEGPHLAQLPDGDVLLTAACFLRGRPRGSRQRLLLALAPEPAGPYSLLGTPLEPAGDDGENGHGCSVVDGKKLHVLYQERAGQGDVWHLRHAAARLPIPLADEMRRAS